MLPPYGRLVLSFRQTTCLETGYHGGNTPSPLARAATSAPKPPAVEHPSPAWGMRPYTSCTFLLALSYHGSPLFSYSSPTRLFLNIMVPRFEELGPGSNSFV